MSLSESLEKFLGTVATSMSSDEQSAAVAEIVAGVRALEGLPPLPKPIAPAPVEAPVEAPVTNEAPAGGVASEETGQQ